MEITASHKDTCVGCGERIDIGEEIHWEPDDGARCLDCGPHTGEPKGAATGMEDAPGYVRVLGKRIDKLETRQQELDLAIGQAQRVMFKLTEWAVKLSAELEINPPEVLDV